MVRLFDHGARRVARRIASCSRLVRSHRDMLLLIPLLPFLGFLLNASFGRRLSKAAAGAVACAAMAGSFAVSLAGGLEPARAGARGPRVAQPFFSWIASGDFSVAFTLRLDPLASVMILVVTGIGSLIHIYSTAYMHEESDSEFARYFSYLNLFAAFMLVLVLGSNFLVMFVGWEGRRPLFVSADRLLVSEEVGVRRGQESVHRQSHRRLRVRAGRAAHLRALRHARFPGDRAVARAARAGDGVRDDLASSRCCCSSARPASPRRFRSSSGCRTPWRGRRRSRR